MYTYTAPEGINMKPQPIHVDLAESVRTLRNRQAPVEHYMQLTNPSISRPIAQDLMNGKLTFVQTSPGKWALTIIP